MAVLPLTSADPAKLQGLSVLITGGASGLGLSTATFLARSGALVTIADVQDGSTVADEMTAQGYKVQFVRCDVTDWDAQIDAFRSALNMSPTKTLDAVAVFAGIDRSGHLVDHVAAVEPSLNGPVPAPPDLASVDVNLKGAIYTATLALHYLRLQASHDTSDQSGLPKSLTIVSSLAGYLDDTHNSTYTASKFGSRGLFRAIRTQAYGQLQIRVNCICPWAMLTPMTAPLLQQMEAFGIRPNHGITLVDHDVLTQAVVSIVTDQSIYGRAIAIVPEGAVDIGDDIAGGYGGPVLADLMALRKAAGDFLQG